jgi:hypothetical protein
MLLLGSQVSAGMRIAANSFDFIHEVSCSIFYLPTKIKNKNVYRCLIRNATAIRTLIYLFLSSPTLPGSCFAVDALFIQHKQVSLLGTRRTKWRTVFVHEAY